MYTYTLMHVVYVPSVPPSLTEKVVSLFWEKSRQPTYIWPGIYYSKITNHNNVASGSYRVQGALELGQTVYIHMHGGRYSSS